MNDCYKLIGNSIRDLRLKNGITQDNLAIRSQLHRAYIGGVERGERNICIRNLEKIASALKIPISDLMKNAGL